MDLMRGIIIRVRMGDNIETSQNVLISMLENLLSQMGVDEKKHILESEYGMVMTTELEGRMQTMCNLSQGIAEINFEKGINQGIEQGIQQGIKQGIEQGIVKERLDNLKRMIKAGVIKDQIILCGYTEEEIMETEKDLCVNV